MEFDGRTVVHIEVDLDHVSGPEVSASELAEEICQTIYGTVYVGDSEYEIGTANDVSEYVGPLIDKDIGARQ